MKSERRKIDGEWFDGPYRLNEETGQPFAGYDLFDRLPPKLREKHRSLPYMSRSALREELRKAQKPRKKPK